jgi:SAM-dependent methyltransferase
VTRPGPGAGGVVAAACPLCGAAGGGPLAAGLRDVENGVPGSYDISRCRSCGLVYLATVPGGGALSECYDDDYHVRADRMGNPLLRSLFRLRYRLRHRRLRRALGREPAAVLEFGCGDAQFLVYLEERLAGRCRLAGIELEAERIPLPPGSAIGLVRSCEAALATGDRYDAVVLYDVLEHLPRPVSTLAAIAERLAPGGLLFIAVPSWDSWWRRVFPRHWGGLQIPRHQVFFEPRTLALVLERAGFRIREAHGVFDPGDLSVSVCNWITDRLHLATKPRKAWFYYPVLLLSAPVVLLQNLLGRSGEMEVVAERLRGEPPAVARG